MTENWGRSLSLAGSVPALLASLVMLGAAAARGEDARAVAEQLLAASGTDEMFAGITALVRQQASAQLDPLPGEGGQALKAMLVAAFAQTPLREAVLDSLVASFDEAKARSVMSWYESELGKRVRSLEAELQSPAGQAGLQSFLSELQNKEPEAERVEFALRLGAGIKATDLSLATVIIAMRSVMLAAATLAAPETDQPIAGYIDDLIAENHDQMREQIEFQILVTYQYTGRNLSSDELSRYLDFIESDAAQWFFENMVPAFTNALRRQGQDFAAELATWPEENSALFTQEKAGDSEPQATKPAE